MARQTTQRANELVGLPGELVDALPIEPITRVAEVAMDAGELALKGTSTTQEGLTARKVIHQATSTTSIIASGVGSSSSAQDITSSSFNGTLGSTRMVPARNLKFTLSSHADWDATTMTVTGLDEYGREITEDFTIPNAGNTTLSGSKFFSQINNIHIPAQSGTGGALTLGPGDLMGPLTGLDALGVTRKLTGALLSNLDQATNFLANDVLSIVRDGRVWVATEVDCKAGEQAYVRIVTSGSEVLGAWRNDRDGSISAPDAVPVIGARFDGDTVDRDGFKMTRLKIEIAS